MSDKKIKIAVFSNYFWAYTSSKIAGKCFPDAELSLLTFSTEEKCEKYDFGMEVIDLNNCKSKNITAFFNEARAINSMKFSAAVVDHGFNIHDAILLFLAGFKDIYIIESDKEGKLRRIGRAGFLRIFIRKMPYFFNKALIGVSKRLRMSVSMGSPSELFVETTSACNLKCVGCPTGLGQLKRPPVMIGEEVIGRVMEDSKKNFRYLDIIYPFFYGEPLLNKNIFDYLRKFRETAYPYTRIEMHTNGNIADSGAIASRLIASGIDLVSISLDGTDSASYESFRRGGSFKLAFEFIKNLSAAKKEAGVMKPEIVVQMILTKYSEDRMERFKAMRSEMGADRIVFKEFFHEFTELSDEEAYSMAPSKKELVLDKDTKKKIIRSKNNSCGWVYRAICVASTGDIAACCIDSNASLLRGLNIKDKNIAKVWNSPEYRQFRKRLLRGKIDICNKCFMS